jgi:hypothetical protein
MMAVDAFGNVVHTIEGVVMLTAGALATLVPAPSSAAHA